MAKFKRFRSEVGTLLRCGFRINVARPSSRAFSSPGAPAALRPIGIPSAWIHFQGFTPCLNPPRGPPHSWLQHVLAKGMSLCWICCPYSPGMALMPSTSHNTANPASCPWQRERPCPETAHQRISTQPAKSHTSACSTATPPCEPFRTGGQAAEPWHLVSLDSQSAQQQLCVLQVSLVCLS